MRPDRPVLVSPLRAALAGALLCASYTGAVPAAVTESVAESAEWQPFSRSETLRDGSVLTEYTAGAPAFGGLDARLEVSFSPRFGCDPMIGFVLDRALQPARDDRGELNVSIDGVRIDWPSRLESRAAMRVDWLFADRQQRRTVRLRTDTGDLIVLQRTEGEAIGFSLLGSRDGLRAAEAACRAHEPIPYDGA